MNLLPGVVTLRGYQRAWLRPDLLAALSLWAVLVPQAFAYAQLAGLPPATGLYTALGAMLGYAVFGGARRLNMGPESSVAIVVASVLAPLAGADPERYAALAGLLALMVAGLMLLGYLLRAGVIMRLFSSPVLVGYLAGSGVVIIASQLAKVTGIKVDAENYLTKTGAVLRNLDSLNGWALGCAVFTAVVVLLLSRVAPRLPGPLIALAIATAVVAWAGWGDRMDVLGVITGGIPIPHLPTVRADDIIDLLGPAFSIALLVYAGSVLTARSLAARDGEEVDAQQEFLGYGAANAAAGLLGGFPANGSDSRSMLLAGSGARTQMAGVAACAAVLVTLLALMPLVQDMPQAALGAVIIVTAVRLVDVRAFRTLWRVRRSDFVMAAVTAAGVLTLGVLPGIIVGVVVSLLEVLRRAAMPYTAVLGRTGDGQAFRDIDNYHEAETLPGLVVYRFDAPLFFANADTLRAEIRQLTAQGDPPVRRVVINAEGIYDLDTTGVEVLQRVLDDCDTRGVRLEFARVRTSVRELMQATGLEERLGPERFHQRVADAVDSYRADFPEAVPAVRRAAQHRPNLVAKLWHFIRRFLHVKPTK